MRVVGGKYKGRKFYPPEKIPTRPTTDFAKEGLFSILNNNFDFEDVSYLDLFCGTGNLSFEFASRGCTDITCVDRFPACVNFIQKTITEWQIEGMQVVRADVFQFLQHNKKQYDIIFAGPPYPLENIPELPDLILENNMLKPEGWFILEHNPNHNFKEHPRLEQVRNYGHTIFSIFT